MTAPSLTISFLGTGTSGGVPMIACSCRVCKSTDQRDKRLRSSLLVESATTRLVIDTGPDFRYQMLRQQVQELDAVLFTHPHKDHVAGLDDVKAFNFFSGKPMQVYANELTRNVLLREFSYAFSHTRYPGVPEIRMNEIDLQPFQIGDIPIIPVLVWHLQMPVYGYRIGDFTYITDANRIDDKEKEKIKGSDILVLNTLRKEKHISHFTLQEGIALAEELDARKTYFTHISHQMGTHEEVSKTLPSSVELAYDQLSFSL